MQQFCKHNTAATNRGTIQEGVDYSVDGEVIKGKLQTVQVQYSSRQFTTRSTKESRVPKTEVKIRLPGRAAQNTETED
jgi:hypothetical protein